MSNLEKELNKVIEEHDEVLDIFINKKLKNKLFRRRNRKELVRLLPKIMEHTNSCNSNWMENIYLIQEENFTDIFIDNIHKLDNKNRAELFYNVFGIFAILKINHNQAKKLIDKLLESDTLIGCDNAINYLTIETLYNLIYNNTPELVEYMLKKALMTPTTCSACLPIILQHEEYLNLFYQNIDFLLENLKEVDWYQLKDMLRKDEEVVSKIKNKIEENKKENITTTIKNLYIKQNGKYIKQNGKITKEEATKQMDTILEVVYLLIEDIAKNEHVKVSDMERLGSGAFSTALRIGDKVIKIGCKRGSKTFPNNPYVNATILRKEFPIQENVSFFVEVNERVDTNTQITEEELYQLYKKVRELHLIWFDVAQRNVGRLLKDNEIHWRQELPITDERLGLQPKRGKEVLKAGDIVILDNDLICDENNIPEEISKYSSPLQKQFEQRYNQEKRIKTELNQEKLEPEYITDTQEKKPKKR